MPEPTISLVEVTPFVTLPTTASAASARTHAGLDLVILVVEPDGWPVGILAPEKIELPVDAGYTLDDYADAWYLPTLTAPNTLLLDTVRAMQFDPAIRWHVIVDEGTVTAVVNPRAIFDTATDHSLVAKGDMTWRSDGPLAGDPVAPPPGLCYRCAGPSHHHLTPDQIQARDTFGRALCPIDRSLAQAENPCRWGG